MTGCRVHLEKAATGAIIPQLVVGKPKDNVELQRLDQDDAQNEELETYEFHWQEKVFCQVQSHPFAIHHFAVVEDASTELIWGSGKVWTFGFCLITQFSKLISD